MAALSIAAAPHGTQQSVRRKNDAEDGTRVGTGWPVTSKGGIIMETNGALRKDVRDRIVSSFQSKALPDSRRITVETRDGWFILMGNVRSWAEKAEAQWAAFTAWGVFDVENNIIVSPWVSEEIIFGTQVNS